ncbi:MAG: glycoside hydrolase family 5 protein [Oscillospiraceae bacterium]|jgi:endoglycosylceramidase|nr:glycoside hydrolase family 5 protein [Oscillospiraceae bacterium]
MDKLHADGLRFADERGRTRIFNGVSLPQTGVGRTDLGWNLDDAWFGKFTALGFNLIRFCMVWENLEPAPGQYNESYVRGLDAAFDTAARHGVYIFLDMHQDLYGPIEPPGGDGAPKWAHVTDGKKGRKTRVVWSENYILNKAVARAFDHFWANTPVYGKGLQEHFAALWAMLARRYGEHPALFGFDFFNEPFPGADGLKAGRKLFGSILKNVFFNKKIKTLRLFGDLLRKARRPHALDQLSGDLVPDFAKPALPVIARFDRERYGPFLDKMGTYTRRETPNGFLMLEQSIFCNMGVPLSVPAISVNGAREANQCYAPHAYDFLVDTPAYKYAGDSRVGGLFDVIAGNQERLQMPVVVGEWGAGDKYDASWFRHARFLLEYFDRRQWSQAYWCCHDDDLDSPLVTQALWRSCPVAVAGAIVRYGCTQAAFELEFTQTPQDDHETLLYIHRPFARIEGCETWEAVREYGSGARALRLLTQPGRHHVAVRF